MAYRRGWRSNREAYEEYYQPPDRREALPHRVVNIVPRRGGPSGSSCNFSDESWLNDNDGSWIQFDDGQWSNDDNTFGYGDHRHSSSFHRKSSPTQSDAVHHPQHSYSRDDLRHQLNSWKNSRPHPGSHHSRGSEPLTGSTKTSRTCVGDTPEPLQPAGKFRIVYTRDQLLDLRDSPAGKAPDIPVNLRKGWSACRAKVLRREQAKRDDRDHRPAPSVGIKREHSPADVRSGSKKTKSAPVDLGPALKQEETSGRKSVTVQLLSSSVREELQQEPHCPQAKDSAFTVKKEERVKEEEPKSPSDKGFLTRRSDAIKEKAVEIEKNYRQDCETFRTVVKMLVSKKPSLDGLLQASLDKNLQELKQRCLDALRSFVSELDEILQPPDASA
ncbi:periphilin-1-like isoform X1 [Gouania willdenowi]|uniref:periphilin-1-like isoform X1 n=1 Tax=Gouania willdenowi TaxID=441366 RepID=UPI0010556951|nr:periphilin-1-like isoform X1 [Gouania willdenowi]